MKIKHHIHFHTVYAIVFTSEFPFRCIFKNFIYIFDAWYANRAYDTLVIMGCSLKMDNSSWYQPHRWCGG